MEFEDRSDDLNRMRREKIRSFRQMRHNRNDKTGGIILIIIGILFLLNKIPQTAGWFPTWFFTWPVLLIGIGLVTALKSRFRNPGWVVLCCVGTYFLLLENNLVSLNLKPYILPVGIILLGIFITIKRNRNCNNSRGKFRHWHHRDIKHPFDEPVNVDTSENVLNVNSTFGNIERNVFSKDFKGGNISCVFGGAQINFAQADFTGIATIDISLIFGGADIIIPSNWNVKNEISVVFGGIEDRRTVSQNVSESGKTLILKGNIMFGGMEIKSY
jgi:predicted membrane protein